MRGFGRAVQLLGLALLGGCPSATDFASQVETTGIPEATPADGPLAVKIIFKASESGSFDSPPASTLNSPGSGHTPKRIYRPDGTLIASDGTDDNNWPDWIARVEVMISGSNNGGATHPDCARFAEASTDGVAKCDFDGDSSKEEPCGASSGTFRVSEYDCASGSTTIGNGGGSDGVAIRISFDRTELESYENILAVMEYQASALNAAPADPSNCFNSGEFTPTNTSCADMSWQAFIKHNASEVVQPLMTLVPPALANVDTTKDKGGSKISTKQIFLPLSADTGIKVLQISRVRGIGLAATNFTSRCDTNSALCVGMVIHSISLYRM